MGKSTLPMAAASLLPPVGGQRGWSCWGHLVIAGVRPWLLMSVVGHLRWMSLAALSLSAASGCHSTDETRLTTWQREAHRQSA